MARAGPPPSRGASAMAGWLVEVCKDETCLVLEISGSIERRCRVPGLGNACMCMSSRFIYTLWRHRLALPCLSCVPPATSPSLLLCLRRHSALSGSKTDGDATHSRVHDTLRTRGKGVGNTISRENHNCTGQFTDWKCCILVI